MQVFSAFSDKQGDEERAADDGRDDPDRHLGRGDDRPGKAVTDTQ